MKSKNQLVIIDGHAIIHRAYHALPPMTTKDGAMVNAVYGFVSMLLKVLETLDPSHLVVTFDVSKDTFRTELYKEYKAHREKADDDLYAQIPKIKQLLADTNIDMYEKEGYEADDVIGTIAKMMKDEIGIVTIVTGDKDMLQLVDAETEVYLLKRGLSEFILYTPDKVRAEFGFDPIQMIDYKALCGDSSDNIPGIKGIGDKTAKKYIEAFTTIENMYEELEKNGISVLEQAGSARMAKKIIEQEESARLSYTLATIEKAVPELDFTLADSSLGTFDADGLKVSLTEYEFFSLLKRLPGEQAEVEEKKIDIDIPSVRIVGTDIGIKEFEKKLENTQKLFFHPQFSSSDMVEATIDSIVCTFDDTDVYYFSLSTTENKNILYAWIAQDKNMLIGHDVKAFVGALQKDGAMMEVSLFDTMIASYLINSSTRSHGMRSVIMRELTITLPEESKQESLFGTDPQQSAPFAVYIKKVYERYVKKLEEVNALDVFTTIEMPLIPILAAMERIGIAVDIEKLAELSTRVAEEIAVVSKNIWNLSEEEFNISSSKQLRDILYETLALPTEGIKKGKTGYSTAASELEKLREYHEIIPYIEEYRELEKLRNTYIDVFPTLIHKKTNRIHTSYNQAVATTGRLSSSDPNLQNIPVRTKLGREIREAFVAAPGYTLVAADYSQMELRIVAHLAQDERLLQTFKDQKDVHTATAAIIHGIPEEDVTKQIRRTAKEVNFGVLYGMGPWGLASRTGISRAEAKEFIDTYFEKFSGVKKYLEETLAFAEKHGYVETVYGRRRYIPELQSSNYQLRNSGERMAINMPIQGTQADIMKLAMIALDAQLQTNYTEADVRMIVQVHDEIILEVKDEYVQVCKKIVTAALRDVVTISVPIVVDTKIGKNWGTLEA